MLGKQSPVLAAVASRRRLERLQDPLLGGRIIFAPLFTRPGSVQKAGNSILSKPSQPLAHARRAGLHPCCDLLAVQTIGGQKNDSGTFHHTPFGFSTAHPVQPRLFLLSRQKLLELAKNFEEAWNNNDASALAALFTEDAVLVNDSGPVNGQAKYCKKGEGRVEEGIESTAVSFEILTSV
jgi:hypothetical protein